MELTNGVVPTRKRPHDDVEMSIDEDSVTSMEVVIPV